MSYSNGLNFLASRTRVLELSNDFGARVAVCPDWNGRVMTSSFNGLEGDSFGMIDVRSIEAADPKEKNYSHHIGGEDQLTLSPSGGPFSLYYQSDGSFYHNNPFAVQEGITIPTGFVEAPFDVDFGGSTQSIRMRRMVEATNISGAKFNLNILRTIRLMNESDLRSLLPDAAVIALEHPEVAFVSFETSNTIINSGSPFSRNSGLLSIRIRSMFNSSSASVIILPFIQGNEDELGPPVQSDFYGIASRKRLHLFPNAALLRADGMMRGQIGVSRRRVIPCCGSIDYRAGVLTVITFSIPENPVDCDYMSNDYFEPEHSDFQNDFLCTREYYFKQLASRHGEYRKWKPDSNSVQSPVPQSHDFVAEITREYHENDPYCGEVVRAYNHGPSHHGKETPVSFYEFDTYSPAKELQKGEHLTHTQTTTHICADSKTLEHLVRSIFKIDIKQVFETVVQS